MEIRLLNGEDVWGDEALLAAKGCMKKGLSDLAVALGARTKSGADDIDGVRAASEVWMTGTNPEGWVHGVRIFPSSSIILPRERTATVCPVIPVSETSKICPVNVKEAVLANGQTIQTGEYGEYPQTIVPEDIRQELEALHQKKGLRATGKNYTFDSAELEDEDTGFIPRNCAEYCHNGKKYVRVVAKPWVGLNAFGEKDKDPVMSDGTTAVNGEAYWFEVQPIEWLMDSSGVWIAKKGLIAGLQFDTKKDYYGNFERTFMHKYLQEHFAEEMQHTITETFSRLAVRNRYFSNYVSGAGENKEFFPEGKDGQQFTPEKAREIVDITNESIFMRDLLKLIAAFPKEQQGQFKDVVLEVFDKERDYRDQPNEVLVLGKKLAVSGGYEKELNNKLNPTFSPEQTSGGKMSSLVSRLGKFFGGR